MLERFLRRAAVAAADDEHPPGGGVRRERRVDEILVVDELLLLGGHVEAVEPEQLAVVRRLVDLHALLTRLPLAELLVPLYLAPGRIVERLHQEVLATVDLVSRD